MVVIVDNVIAKNEEGGNELIVEAAKGSSGISRTCSGRLRLPNLCYETIIDCYHDSTGKRRVG